MKEFVRFQVRVKSLERNRSGTLREGGLQMYRSIKKTKHRVEITEKICFRKDFISELMTV